MPAKRPAARRPTMKDIARRAGVSESAVSFALNDRPGVSEITRDRVRRVAEQLGWRPSTAARALSGEGAATVGFVLARPAHTLGVDSPRPRPRCPPLRPPRPPHRRPPPRA
ncbi:LacI family DNA-binding transcriptional regulator, partial [Streptomyces violaceoruber]